MPPPRHDAWARRATLGARVAVGAATAAVFVLALAPSAAARHRVEPVRSIPVRFRVANTNRSGIPATSDGKTYTVRGHLTGPRRVLAHPHAVTLYFFGYDAGEWNWRLTDVKGYNHPLEMARRGHVSVTIDELGYDSSDHPEGMGTCMGAQADMAHKIVGMLRRGRYGARGRRAPRFSEIVLAGHDVADNGTGAVRVGRPRDAGVVTRGRKPAAALLTALPREDHGVHPARRSLPDARADGAEVQARARWVARAPRRVAQTARLAATARSASPQLSAGTSGDSAAGRGRA